MLTMASASMCFVLFAFAGYPLLSWGCKPGKEENTTYALEWKVMMSDVVAHGVVISTQPGSSSAKGTYSVVFEVRCSYKGDPQPELIRIKDVGFNPHTCLNSSLTEGPKYLVYLKETDDGQFVQVFRQESGESQFVEELTNLCDASIEYPIGKNSTTAKEQCQEKYMYDDCVQRPILANPPYDSGDKQQHSHGSEETVDQKTKEKPDEGKDIPKHFPSNADDDDDDDDGNGSSATLTLNMGTMILLLLVMILPL